MPEKLYDINEAFYSLQGEGQNMGKPFVFLRFAGCNLKCDFCDTMQNVQFQMDARQVRGLVTGLDPNECKSLLITGGEPLLQLDFEVLIPFIEAGWYLALETNGTVRPDFDLYKVFNWVTISPKKGKRVVLPRANEVRVAAGAGMNEHLFLFDQVAADHYYLSPIFDGQDLVEENVQWAVQVIEENPQWNLSIQMHKLMGLK